MNIGELARQTGVSIRALRYYETKRLLSPLRKENGYRSYQPDAIEQVRKIQFYLGLGINTRELQSIFLTEECNAVLYDPAQICPEDQDFIREKLEEIEAQMGVLEKARQYLLQQLNSIPPSPLHS